MRLLTLLLRLLPEAFRREYETEILATVFDKWHAVESELGPAGRVKFWWREWVAVLRLARELEEHGAGSASAARTRNGPARMDGLAKDVRHAFRALRARPGLTLVAVSTLALGVGATTTMFSAVHAVLLRPLPYHDPEAVVVIEQADVSDGSTAEGVSAANLRDMRAWSDVFDEAAVAESHGLRLFEDGRATSLRAWLVSEGFLAAIGVRPFLGRGFRPEEFEPGNERVVLLSHWTWQSRFGADPRILDRELVLDGSRYSVVGVMPQNFDYPSAADLWGPRPPQPWDQRTRASSRLNAIARLAPGVTVARARDALGSIASELSRRHPEANRNLGFEVKALREHLFGDVTSALTLLFGAVCLLLMAASANVTRLQLAKGAARAREFALRGALGASSWRVLRLVIVESAVVSAAATVVGLLLTVVAISCIRQWGPVDVPRIDELRVDGAVLLFAAAAALASSVLSGVVPAVRASNMEPARAMDGTSGRLGGARRGRLRDRLVVAQIATALTLSIGAGLLMRSFSELSNNELGFEPDGRFVFQVWAYDDAHGSRPEFFEQAAEAIRSLPGIVAVGLTSHLPFADDRSVSARKRSVRFRLHGRPDLLGGEEPFASLSVIDRDYAKALGVRLAAGRHFSIEDHERSRPVAMVNEAFVRRHVPGRSPVGRRITLGEDPASELEIVGVLGDTRREGSESEPKPEVYVALSQRRGNGLTFVVHAEATNADVVHTVQETMRSVDPMQATWAARPMTSLVEDWSRQRRFNTALFATFAAVSLSLVAVGVFGLMSFSVETRVPELGLRRVLGGQSSQILRMVLADGLRLAVAGVSVGLVSAAVASRLLESMLFRVARFDPVTYAAVAVFVVVVALIAAFIPAWRASRVDPLDSIRSG